MSERGFGHFRDRCLGTVHRLDESEPLVGDDPQSNSMDREHKSRGISHAFFRRLAFLKGRLFLLFGTESIEMPTELENVRGSKKGNRHRHFALKAAGVEIGVCRWIHIAP